MDTTLNRKNYNNGVFKPRPGIRSKLRLLLTLQLCFISIVTVLGVFVAALIVEKGLIGAALKGESKHYWEQLAIDPEHALPNTDNLIGYRLDASGANSIPSEFQDAPPGRSRIAIDGRVPIVYVEQQGDVKLVLEFDEQSVKKLSFWFGVVPLSLALILLYISAWIFFIFSSRTLSPLTSLALKMRKFSSSNQSLASLEFDDWSGPTVDAEVSVLADSLREFTERLKSLLAKERAFSRDVSHELRTPLAVLSGSLELLEKQGQLQPQQQRVVDRMQRTSADMKALIELLLLLAQTDHRGAASRVQTNVSETVDALMEQLADSHNADNHVQLQVEHRSNLLVEAPVQAVAMVVGNLMRNACNYTREGTVDVTVTATGVHVSDTGAGMTDQQVQKFMQPFQRESAGASGYGLGLDIVKRLCDHFGWKLSINSTFGQGTKVTVEMLIR